MIAAGPGVASCVMKVIIVGGGIGGLTTALMLHERGIDCEIYEQSETIRELGVGINTLPHAIKELAEQAGRDPRALTYAAPAYERTFEDVLRSLPRYQQVGLDHVVLAFFMWTESFTEMLGLMERFAREVGLRRAQG